MIMAMGKKKMKPRDELIAVAMLILAAFGAWYVVLYKPVVAKTAEIINSINVDQDSLVAIERYKLLTVSLDAQTKLVDKNIIEWDAGFPPRSSLVVLAKEIVAFSHSQELILVEMQPSLFELYALENSGNKVAGKFIQKQLFNVTLRGRFLDFGRMLEHIDRLSFNVTIADVEMTAIEDKIPLVEINMNLFLYVHQ